MRNPQWKIFLACEMMLFVLAELPARQASGIKMRKRMILDNTKELTSSVQQATHHDPINPGLPHTPQDLTLAVHQPPMHNAAYGSPQE
ncbi:putative signal peptide protein [Puccinia sorghi]|uniref:Putative signal peptide protein n=1 Tax=Puccinia sorghi TaxID=27349 RepID=A0A0L6V4F6_9BASI|nr:putative signal peptide protein [Puccinia sorghi]